MIGATFIMSLDCEGKWGMANQLTNSLSQVLTYYRLNETYMKICHQLNEYEVDATFTFVGVFTISESKYLN